MFATQFESAGNDDQCHWTKAHYVACHYWDWLLRSPKPILFRCSRGGHPQGKKMSVPQQFRDRVTGGRSAQMESGEGQRYHEVPPHTNHPEDLYPTLSQRDQKKKKKRNQV